MGGIVSKLHSDNILAPRDLELGERLQPPYCSHIEALPSQILFYHTREREHKRLLSREEIEIKGPAVPEVELRERSPPSKVELPGVGSSA